MLECVFLATTSASQDRPGISVPSNPPTSSSCICPTTSALRPNLNPKQNPKLKLTRQPVAPTRPQADSDDLQALKTTVSGAATAAAAAEAAATAATTAARAFEPTPGDGLSCPVADQGGDRPSRRAQSGGGDPGGGGGGGAFLRPVTQQEAKAGAMYYGGRAAGAAAVVPTSRGLSREEARLLIRAELKRAGISDKITRCDSRSSSVVHLFFARSALPCRTCGRRESVAATRPNSVLLESCRQMFDEDVCPSTAVAGVRLKQLEEGSLCQQLLRKKGKVLTCRVP